MEELLKQYTGTEIVLFVLALATAIKGFFTLWDWFYDRLKNHFKKMIKEVYYYG